MNKAILLIAITFVSASASFGQNNSGSAQQRDLKNFSAISLDIPAQLTLKQGDYAFSISASQDLLEKIKTEVHNGELVIKFDNSFHPDVKEPIKIEISLPSLEALEVNGSGQVNSESNFSGEKLNLEINGSGRIKLSDLAMNDLSAEINGSGRIENLKGTASNVKMQVNGSGEISTQNFSGKEVDCTVTGSGHISVGATESLNAEVTGSGDIQYAGSPEKKNINVTGSGTVTAMK